MGCFRACAWLHDGHACVCVSIYIDFEISHKTHISLIQYDTLYAVQCHKILVSWQKGRTMTKQLAVLTIETFLQRDRRPVGCVTHRVCE